MSIDAPNSIFKSPSAPENRHGTVPDTIPRIALTMRSAASSAIRGPNATAMGTKRIPTTNSVHSQ